MKSIRHTAVFIACKHGSYIGYREQARSYALASALRSGVEPLFDAGFLGFGLIFAEF